VRSRCILYEYKYEHERLCTSTVHTAESSTPSQRQIRRVMIPYQPKWATALVVVLLLAGGHPSCASHEMEMEVSMKSLYCWKLHLFPKVAEMIPRSLHHPRPGLASSTTGPCGEQRHGITGRFFTSFVSRWWEREYRTYSAAPTRSSVRLRADCCSAPRIHPKWLEPQ
jgi:hypothetical protein